MFPLCSSTPVEALHTILLGMCKYMLRAFMDKLSAEQKQELLARIASFPYCGFSNKITGNIIQHYRSFVGRDLKAFIQMAVFVISPYLTEEQKKCWLLLSKVSMYMYIHCTPVHNAYDQMLY